MPAQAGIHLRARCKAKENLDSGLRRNDDTEESTSSRRIQNASALSRGSFSCLTNAFHAKYPNFASLASLPE